MDTNPLEKEQPVSVSPTSVPSRPEYPSRRKGNKAVGLIIFLILIVVVGGSVFYFFSLKGGDKSNKIVSTPEPFIVRESGEKELEVTPSPVVGENKDVVDKKSVSISVLNGTGITGEAAYLQNKLEDLGYTNIKVGNASKQDYEQTIIKFSSDVSKSVIDEITTELKKIYTDVKTQTGITGSYDIEITTGLRSGQTPRVVSTLTPTPKSTPKPSPSPTSKPTTTPSPTPTL